MHLVNESDCLSDVVHEMLSDDLFRRYGAIAHIEHPEPWYTLTSSCRSNWKTYIPEVVQANWDKLSFEAKVAVYLTALDQVRREP